MEPINKVLIMCTNSKQESFFSLTDEGIKEHLKSSWDDLAGKNNERWIRAMKNHPIPVPIQNRFLRDDSKGNRKTGICRECGDYRSRTRFVCSFCQKELGWKTWDDNCAPWLCSKKECVDVHIAKKHSDIVMAFDDAAAPDAAPASNLDQDALVKAWEEV